MKINKISAAEFERRFDAGEDITKYLDLSKVRRINQEIRRINVDLPNWIINSLDFEARRLGVTRQSIIKVWLADRLRQENSYSVSGESGSGYNVNAGKSKT